MLIQELSDDFLSEHLHSENGSQFLTLNSKATQSLQSRQTAQLGVQQSEFTFFQSVNRNASQHSAHNLSKSEKGERCFA